MTAEVRFHGEVKNGKEVLLLKQAAESLQLKENSEIEFIDIYNSYAEIYFFDGHVYEIAVNLLGEPGDYDD